MRYIPTPHNPFSQLRAQLLHHALAGDIAGVDLCYDVGDVFVLYYFHVS